MLMRRIGVLAGSLLVTAQLAVVLPASAAEFPPVVSLDPHKATRSGSPLDHLPHNVVRLPIHLPHGSPQRAGWSPDGRRLVFLDGPVGDAWSYNRATGVTRDLTQSTAVEDGVLRAQFLSNGDLVMCAFSHASAAPAEDDRFRGWLWVLPRPLGRRAAVPLGESCWEGIAVSKHRGSTRIAWNRSNIDFSKVPDVFVQALIGRSEILTGRIRYRRGRPRLTGQRVVLDKRDVSPETPAVEAQDFRQLHDKDASPDDELVFTAYFHEGGQVMGVNLDTGAVSDFAPASPFYEEAEGIDPAGNFVVVERDLAVTLFPGQLDLWRLALDGSGDFTRLTRFDYYKGYGADNAVVSPDGRHLAFGLKIDGEEGEGKGLLLMRLKR
jgi:hypothetical protein